MCGRYSNTRGKADDVTRRLTELMGVPRPQSDVGFERFNIAPTDPVVVAVDDDDGRRLATLRWGLKRHWMKDDKARFQMINARAETIQERPAYRDLVEQSKHRCLVLADGWYEWQKPEDPKQPRRPVRFSLRGGEPFAFAGLWIGDSCRSSPARPTPSRCRSTTGCRSCWGDLPRGRPGSIRGSTAPPRPSCSGRCPRSKGRAPRKPARQLGGQRRSGMPRPGCSARCTATAVVDLTRP